MQRVLNRVLDLSLNSLPSSIKPLVSVIMPAFDAAKHVSQALNSVLSQTYEAIEVIVVNDGSSDATSSIVEEFVRRDSRVQLIWQNNAGVGAARNTAIEKSRGEYIAPLDADDFWFPQKREKQVACMERCSETGLVYCWSQLIDEQENFLGDGYPATLEGRLPHELVLRNFVGCASVPLFRRTALEKVGLYLTRAEQGGCQGCEDWDLALRIAETYSIGVVPELQVAYRQVRSSMSVKAEGMVGSFSTFMLRARQRNCELPSAAFRWSTGYFYLYTATKCCWWGQYSNFLSYVKEAIHANPILLLKTEIYVLLSKRLLDFVKDLRGIRVAERVRPLREKKNEKRGGLSSRKVRKHSFISDRIFSRLEQIELKRWSNALKSGG
jgi:glycosyltransferase involved in cell wall biosynthesis